MQPLRIGKFEKKKPPNSLGWLPNPAVQPTTSTSRLNDDTLAKLVTFTLIVVPSFAFVIAFSLACPLVMPLGVYQILFTGYWFWGNFLNSKFVQTISDTLLNASGVYALQRFFGGYPFNPNGQPPATSLEA